MSKLEFKIRRPRGVRPREGLPAFVLEQDYWNDYSFQTLYHLSHYQLHSAGHIEESLIGPVKILKRSQTRQDGLLVQSNFERLGEDFCSVGQSLDYYERLNALGESVKNDVLKALRDVVQTPALVSEFQNEEGWSTSLFRNHRDGGLKFMTIAQGLITGDYSHVPNETMRFSFRIPEWSSNAEFNFGAAEDNNRLFSSKKILPERIAVLGV